MRTSGTTTLPKRVRSVLSAHIPLASADILLTSPLTALSLRNATEPAALIPAGICAPDAAS